MRRFGKTLIIGALALLTATPAALYARTDTKTREIKVNTKTAKHRPISYNKLLKSFEYDTMYTRALQYFNFRKTNRKGEKVNPYGNYVKSASLLERATARFGGTPREDSIAYYLSASYYKQGDFQTSAYMLDVFRKRFPQSVFAEDVSYMYALSFYYASPDPEYDQTSTLQAMVAIREYLERYPQSKERESLNAKYEELQQKLYDKELLNAKVYYKIGEYKSAVVALSNAIDKYPKSNHCEEMTYLVARSQYNLAKNSIESKQTDRYLDVMDRCYNFLSAYPDSKYIKDTQKMLADAKSFIASKNLSGDQVIVPSQPDSEKQTAKSDKTPKQKKTKDK